ncbi:MAG: ABC transporter ATP-binding protein [Chromatiales bacterium]|nr:ABC transporter ATP-binding protein [Chromatiales bacterium]
MSTLSVDKLSIKVGERHLCNRLTLTLNPAERWAILGANGSGKTTLLHTMTGLLPLTEGSVELDGHPITTIARRAVAQRLGLLLQDSHDPFPVTVLESVLSGRHPHLERWSQEGEEDLAIARQALAAMALDEMEGRMVQTLSGGERRRLAIATLLTQDPALMLLDEPLNHLDLRHQQQLLQRLKRLGDEGKGVMMVLHDPNLALRYCDRALLLYGDGSWESGSCQELLTTERLSRLYGYPIRQLMEGSGRIFIPEE